MRNYMYYFANIKSGLNFPSSTICQFFKISKQFRRKSHKMKNNLLFKKPQVFDVCRMYFNENNKIILIFTF